MVIRSQYPRDMSLIYSGKSEAFALDFFKNIAEISTRYYIYSYNFHKDNVKTNKNQKFYFISA